MFKMNIKLNSINDVKEFVQIMSTIPFDVDIVSGRYIIDAKSIMGIFSLDLSTVKQLSLHTDNRDEIDSVKNKITKFLV